MIKRAIDASDSEDGTYGFEPYFGLTLTIANITSGGTSATLSIFFRNTAGQPYTIPPEIPGTAPTLDPNYSFTDFYLIKDLVIPYGASLTIKDVLYEMWSELMAEVTESLSNTVNFKAYVQVTVGKVQLLGYAPKTAPEESIQSVGSSVGAGTYSG